MPLAQKTFQWVAALVLWLVTIGLGLLVFVALQDIFIIIGVRLFVNEGTGLIEGRGFVTTLRNFSAILGGLFLLVVGVGGADYYLKYAGQRKIFRVAAWTIGFELVILVIWVIVLLI